MNNQRPEGPSSASAARNCDDWYARSPSAVSREVGCGDTQSCYYLMLQSSSPIAEGDFAKGQDVTILGQSSPICPAFSSQIWPVDMDILFEWNPSDLAPNLSPNLVGVPALLAAVSFGACKTLQYFSLTGHTVILSKDPAPARSHGYIYRIEPLNLLLKDKPDT